MHLRNLQNTDPFEGTQEEKLCLEDVLGLSSGPDDYYKVTDISSIHKLRGKFLVILGFFSNFQLVEQL